MTKETKNTKIALVTDFDGTIIFDDIFWFLVDHYLDKEQLEPWNQYLRGELNHFDALNQIFQNLRVSEEELNNFVKGIKPDEYFLPTVELCKEKHIPIYITSAGCDYYINKIIGDIITEYGITLITNKGEYSEETGLKMTPLPKDSPFYNKEIGISKKAVVEKLQEEGYKIIFAGDGKPDFAPAEISEVVFARKSLLKRCKEEGIKTERFQSYKDIYTFIERL